MAISQMVSHDYAKSVNFRNITIVHNYPGHEAGRIVHDPACPHHARFPGGIEIGPKTRPDCLDWDKAMAIRKEGKFTQAYYCSGPFEPLYMETTHEGLVLDASGEYNDRDDSDFYALVWNPEKGHTERVTYASTRGWTYPNSASADATPEVVAAYEAWRDACARQAAEERRINAENRAKAEALKAEELARKTEQAKAEVQECGLKKGDKVTVVRGVHKGKEGEVFWVGAGRGAARIGVKLASGAKEFFNLGQVQSA